MAVSKPAFRFPGTSALAVATSLAALSVMAVYAPDWRVSAAAVAAGLTCLCILRFPDFGLFAVVSLLFVGTPSLKFVHSPTVMVQVFPFMLLIPPVLLGYLARAATLRRGLPMQREPVNVMTPIVAAIVLLEALAVAWAPDSAFAWGNLATLVGNVVVFTLIVAAVADEKRLVLVFWAVIAGGVILGASMTYANLYDYRTDTRLAQGLVYGFELFSQERWSRVGGLCPATQAGGYMTVAAILAAGLSRRYTDWRRVLLYLLAMAFAVFLVLSQSRGAIIGLVGAGCLFLVLDPRTRPRLLSRTGLFGVLLLAAVFIGQPSFIDRMLVGFGYSGELLFTDKKNSSSGGESNVSGTGARYKMWSRAFAVMEEDPLKLVVGLGPGGFVWHTGQPEVHSLWLAFFFDLGIPGVAVGLLGLGLLSFACLEAIRRARPGPVNTLFLTALIAFVAEDIIHALIDYDLTASSVSRFAWLFLAVLAASLKLQQQEIAASSPATSWRSVAVHE